MSCVQCRLCRKTDSTLSGFRLSRRSTTKSPVLSAEARHCADLSYGVLRVTSGWETEADEAWRDEDLRFVAEERLHDYLPTNRQRRVPSSHLPRFRTLASLHQLAGHCARDA